MRFAALALATIAVPAACGPRGEHRDTLTASGPRLPPPPAANPAARGASYLAALEAVIQPAWGQFLEDCRLRLAGSHPLNRLELVAVAELTIEPDGRLTPRIVTGSGNGDFDTAAFDVLADVSPVARPPRELLADDERAHIRWLFARDRRQAGAATAAVFDVQLPLGEVVARLIRDGRLDQAIRRIDGAPTDDERGPATERVMIATLALGVVSRDGAVRRAAVDAIGRARVQSLAGEVGLLIAPIPDLDLRIAAITAAGELGDVTMAPTLARDLGDDLAQRPRLGLAKVAALVRLGRAKDVVALVARAADRPTPTTLAVLALVPDPTLAKRWGGWMTDRDPRVRGAACGAIAAAGATAAQARAMIGRGLEDGDASVRAACARVAPHSPSIVQRLGELTRDRDRTVRANAIAALSRLDPTHRTRAPSDPAPEVRAASTIGASEAMLRTLATDRDPTVRAAALTALGDRAPEVVAGGAHDLAAPVRLAAISVVTDEATLERLASDPTPEVATAALIRLVGRRGRAAAAHRLLADWLVAPADGPERVRIALAWLLAR